MRQKVVGTYPAGMDDWKLILRAGHCAEFHTAPTLGSNPVLTLGADVPWQKCVEYLMHESFELALVKFHCRYVPSFSPANSNDAYAFMCNHNQFADCAAIVGEFVAGALPDLSKAHKQWQKTRQKKNK